MILMLFLSISTSAMFALVRVYIDEPENHLFLREELSLSVNIEGMADDLRGYKVHVSFDPNYLEIADMSAFQEGPYLSDIGRTQFYVDGSNGEYNVTCSLMGITSGALGDGNLFTVQLKAKSLVTGDAGTDVILSDIVMRDLLNNEIGVGQIDNANVVIEAAPLYNKIKVFLQGPYISGGSMNHALTSVLPLTSPYDSSVTISALPNVSPHYIVDWVDVELRTGLSSASEQRMSAFVLENGSVVDITGNPILEWQYITTTSFYVIIKHRNHLGIVSANAHTFSYDQGTVPTVDLTISSSVHGGDGTGIMVVETGVLAMFSGDADSNGQVQNFDRYSGIQSQIGFTGYYLGDTNMNGQVQNSDIYGYTLPNMGKASFIP